MRGPIQVLVAAMLIVAFGVPIPGHAATTSYTGTLASSDSIFELSLNLPTASEVILQTYGFGGGVNAAGTVIAPGGTDPFVAIFQGVGASASILTDGLFFFEAGRW